MSIAPAPELRTVPLLTDHDVHVWLLPGHDANSAAGKQECDRWMELLSTDELERASRFHFAHLQVAYIANRARLRELLGEYLGQEPGALRFVYGPQGKPTLPDDEIAFNLSHTDGLAVAAFSRRGQLGVDVERSSAAADVLDLARTYFSAKEVQELQTYTHLPEQQAAFLRCWTRKEAFLKASGDGLTRPLADFTVSCGEHDPAVLECLWEPEAVNRWNLVQLDPGPGCIAALACDRRLNASNDSIQTFVWRQG